MQDLPDPIETYEQFKNRGIKNVDEVIKLMTNPNTNTDPTNQQKRSAERIAELAKRAKEAKRNKVNGNKDDFIGFAMRRYGMTEDDAKKEYDQLQSFWS